MQGTSGQVSLHEKTHPLNMYNLTGDPIAGWALFIYGFVDFLGKSLQQNLYQFTIFKKCCIQKTVFSPVQDA